MDPVVVKITEDDLFLAATELYNSGWVEWIATDGTVVRLESRY
jgi:hypothetical protein